MQIVNYVRAKVFKSSYAALDLVRKNHKYTEFAKKIVSVKRTTAYCNLITNHSNLKKYNECLYKINKYDFILKRFLLVENISSKPTNSKFSDDFNELQKPNLLRLNDYGHECFLSCNNKGDEIIFTKIDERLI